MTRLKNNSKGKWLLLLFAVFASLIFTGCEEGNLGVKTGCINGYILDIDTNKPVASVLVKAKGTTSIGAESKSTYSEGDGSFVFAELSKGTWVVDIEKYGYALATDSADPSKRTIDVNNGETAGAFVIKVYKETKLYKGTLKAYPVDAVTGKPLNNFTVTQITPYSQRKSKTFETAAEFRDTGWTNLDGGEHHYTITAKGYKNYTTENGGEEGGAEKIVTIGNAVANLGTVKVYPIDSISISGSMRLPGYVLEADDKNIAVWVEAAGKQIASFTTTANNADAFTGSLNFTIPNIPATAGTVNVRSKVRGFEPYTLKSNIPLSAANPGGTIYIGETDFINDVPKILRDVRIIIRGTMPSPPEDPGSFKPGDRATVYVLQGGPNTTTTATSVNHMATVVIPNVITGYPFEFIAQNIDNGYCAFKSEPIIIQEGGSDYFTIECTLESN